MGKVEKVGNKVAMNRGDWLERIYPISGVVEKNATLEVAPSRRTLVQARGKCNCPLTTKATSVVKRWAAANGITVRLMV